jgi:nucleoside phosphorylase
MILKQSADVVILTVLPEEYDAIRALLSRLRPPSIDYSTPNLYAWQFGDVICKKFNGAYTVALGMVGHAGTMESALATIEAIRQWRPRYIFFAGIAGGLSGLAKGDVVIADVIYGYEYGKIDKLFLPRGNWTYKTDKGLLNCANAYALSADWRDLIKKTHPLDVLPRASSGEVASGDKVVENPGNEFFSQVIKTWPKVKAVEMEGAGVGCAIEQAHSLGIPVGFLMVRGISDIPRQASKEEIRGTQERDSWKQYASDTAAAFTIGFIADGLPMPPGSCRPNSSLNGERLNDSAIKNSSNQPVVFISYRGQDADLAERLAEEIRNDGFEVWLDQWKIEVGDTIVEKIKQRAATPP